ncbi:MAG: peptidoglycan DD-metalloendopeptidase family protein [Patescibacteria group bacterium]
MNPLKEFVFPDYPGTFGAIRKHDIHTGIDLYCQEGSKVYAIEDGVVVSVINFTGKKAGSPWWNDTEAVLIEGNSGVVCYGEIIPLVKTECIIKEGDIVGYVKRVLKKDKGRPMSMLHLELYKHNSYNIVGWNIRHERPENILDPSFLIQR